MDRAQYPDLVKQILGRYAPLTPSYGEVEAEIVFHDAIGHYEVRYLGWDRQRRIDSSVLHVDIKNGKIWIQHDGTEDGIGNELLEAGVPPQDIVVGFHSPYERQFTPFAIG